MDTDDIADVAVAALLGDEHNGKTYQLTGSEALTFKEVINEISEATGREIVFKPIALSTYVDMMKEQGVPTDFIWLIEYLFSEVLSNPLNSEVTNDIEYVLKRKPKSFSKYVNETAMKGIWNNKETL